MTDIAEQIQALSRFADTALLETRLNAATAYLEELPLALIPSIVMAGDGPSLASLFLVTENFLTEVRIGPGHEFDFVNKRRVTNYRVKMWEHEVTRATDVVEVLQVAEVTLTHGEGAVNTMQYAGTRRAAWLDDVRRVIPASCVLDHPSIPTRRPLP